MSLYTLWGSSHLNAITGTNLPSSLDVSLFDSGHLVTLTFNDTSSLTATLNSVSVTSASAVPEPSTYAAIAGAAMLGFTVWRRRRLA